MAQEEQPLPPFEDVNFPPLFEPKTENLRSTLAERQEAQETFVAAPDTSFSNSWPQRLQRNS